MDVLPSMVLRSGGKLSVRQATEGASDERIKTEVKQEHSSTEGNGTGSNPVDSSSARPNDQRTDEGQLPQCKVKRNYACPSCAYSTQNPRSYLTHRRDAHGEKISISECPQCLYASRHHQKLLRHMRMVHGWAADTTNRQQRPVKRECSTETAENPGSRGRLTPGKLKNEDNEEEDTYGQHSGPDLTKQLLKLFDKQWHSSIAANFELLRIAFKPEMDNFLTNNAPLGCLPVDAARGDTKQTRRRSQPEEDSEQSPRKRHRPIPNLIPLASPPVATVAVRPEKELLKPVPMASLMPQEGQEKQHQHKGGMKCTFCELTYHTTVDLANHIEVAHKEDLFTSLLQQQQQQQHQNHNLFPQSEPDGASNDLWKSLLEVGHFGGGPEGTPPSSEPNGKPPVQAEEDEVEILDNKTETYCGVETAPGYGEITSKLAATEDTAGAVLKKVFKCPHCSFWASTASRFHVHIVGHLNKKPFECSLCSYRSNWRWDITKHIRLKTIRDPSHKNAGVLMNDETGRRNYTKYNKYITLLQIAGEGSPKESAGAGAGAGAKSFAESTVSDLVTAACSAYNIDLKAFAHIPGFQLLLDEHKQHLGEEPKAPSYGTFPMQQCPACEFRTSSNEELLLHTATVHSAPATTLLQLDDGSECELTTTDGGAGRHCTVTGGPSPVEGSALGSLSKAAANMGGGECNGTLLTTGPGAAEPGDGGESGQQQLQQQQQQRTVAMPTWRHNAPYRCGHCHQVSNWKHVIQRHCRLKHNGNVLIEHINPEKDDPSDGEGAPGSAQRSGTQHSVYVVDDGQPSGRDSVSSLAPPAPPPLPPALPQPPPLAPFASDELAGYGVASSLEPIVEIYDKDPADLLTDSSTVLVSSGTVAPVIPGERLDCVSCQFHAETIEQLTEHLEAHIGGGQQELLDPVPTVLYYCPRCPARFFDQCHVVEHEQRHGAGGAGSIRCPVCSYDAPQEEDPSRHLEVHSAAYNKNTENLQIFLTESKQYPKPRLTTIQQQQQQQPADQDDAPPVWCVETRPEDAATAEQPPKSPKRTKRPKQRPDDSAVEPPQQPPVRSIFLCEYCDSAFDVEAELNAHVRAHFSAILGTGQHVAYYTSLGGSNLGRDRKLELVISGAQTPLPLHRTYDNSRRKEWVPFSKADSVLLKL